MQGRNERNTGINPCTVFLLSLSSCLLLFFPPFIPSHPFSDPVPLLFFFFLLSSRRVSVLARVSFFFFRLRNLPDTPRWITVPFNLRLMENAGWMEIRGRKKGGRKKVPSRDNYGERWILPNGGKNATFAAKNLENPANRYRIIRFLGSPRKWFHSPTKQRSSLRSKREEYGEKEVKRSRIARRSIALSPLEASSRTADSSKRFNGIHEFRPVRTPRSSASRPRFESPFQARFSRGKKGGKGRKEGEREEEWKDPLTPCILVASLPRGYHFVFPPRRSGN